MAHYQMGLPTWKDAKPIVNRMFILLGDMLMVIFAYSCAYFLRFYLPSFLQSFPITKGLPPISEYIQASPVILFMWAMAMLWHGAYQRLSMLALDDAIRFARIAFLGTLLAMSAMFLYRDISYSRLVFVLGGIFSFVTLYAWRELVKKLYLVWIRRSRRAQRVLILGGGYLSITLQKILKRHGDRAILTRAHFSFESIRRTLVRSRINEVLVANPNLDHKEIVQLATFCEDREISFRLLPDVMEIRMGEVLIDESLGIPTIQLKPVSLHGSSFFVKRFIDVTFACILVGVFFLPLFVISVLIKTTSKGALLYKHKRVGYRGREFDFMKFRTMVKNADDLLENLKCKSERGEKVFKMKNDPRVTRIGKFLRRYSLDEIPQVINVLRGEMSLIGPRPQVLWEAAQYDDWARKRLNVLPGITGLWQVSGRAELTYQEMIDLDIFYIEHWSPGLDLKILLKTIPVVLLGRGAY